MAGDPVFDWVAFVLGVVAGFGACFMLMRRKGRVSAPPPPIAPIELPPELRAIVLRYRAEGRAIDAVKIVRERMGCDLRTARLDSANRLAKVRLRELPRILRTDFTGRRHGGPEV